MEAITRRGFAALAAGAAVVGAGMNVLGTCPASAEEVAGAADEVRDVDVVVVGAGTGGLAAGLQAAELGLSCVVLEKLAMVGGTSAYAEGMFAIGSRFQEERRTQTQRYARASTR